MLRSLTQDATLAALKCSKDLSVRFFLTLWRSSWPLRWARVQQTKWFFNCRKNWRSRDVCLVRACWLANRSLSLNSGRHVNSSWSFSFSFTHVPDYWFGGGFFLACEDLGRIFDKSLPACALNFVFVFVEITDYLNDPKSQNKPFKINNMMKTKKKINMHSNYFSTGIRHPTIICDECGESGIVGIRWKCVQCFEVDLCTLCYFSDEHNCSHQFWRFETPNSVP